MKFHNTATATADAGTLVSYTLPAASRIRKCQITKRLLGVIQTDARSLCKYTNKSPGKKPSLFLISRLFLFQYVVGLKVGIKTE